MTVNYRDNATPSDIVSGEFGVETIALASGSFTGQGADQLCREVIIWAELGKTVRIGEDASAATTGPILAAGIASQDNGSYLRIPISNTNKLYFKGTAEDDVYLLWRS